MRITHLIVSIFLGTILACTTSTNKESITKSTDQESVEDQSRLNSERMPNFDTTTVQGKADKILWGFKDSYVGQYGEDTLIDMNGDKYPDILIEYYGSAGTGLKNIAEIILFDKSSKCFLADSSFTFFNPTFDFKNNTVASYYIASGGGDAYKFKWNGLVLDTLESIDLEITMTEKERSKVVSNLYNYKTGKTSKTISETIDLPQAYHYFDYKPIVRKD